MPIVQCTPASAHLFSLLNNLPSSRALYPSGPISFSWVTVWPKPPPPQSPAPHPVHQFLCTLNATYSLSFHFTKYLSQKNQGTEAKDTPRHGIFVIAAFSAILGLTSLHSKMAAITYAYILGISCSSQFPNGPMSLPILPLLSLSPNSLPIDPSSLISPSSLHNTIF